MATKLVNGVRVEMSTEEESQFEASRTPTHGEKVSAIESDFEAEVAQITAGYSQSEIDSWPEQLKEAEAWTADNSASTPLVDAAIAQNNRTKAEHIGKIMTNAGLYKVAIGGALGRKQKKIADLNA